ncbi:MAG: pirin family protein [Chloroflexota bacterium]|nr:pirin family protein [Chloroflexota bacterium]
MPTIYVDNLSKLQRLTDSGSVKMTRPVVNVVKSVAGFEGEGFPVNRAFTNLSLSDLDPFIMMDEMGAVEYSVGEAKGTPWHPHRGFETVTYMIDGKIKHKDSQGGGGLITDGDTQWMTAGSGILHIEAPPEDAVLAGGLFHGIQIWVNLPRLKKWSSPKYQDIKSNNISLIASADAGSLIRVIAGNIGPGIVGPGSTMTPINFFHVTINPNSVVSLDWPKHFNAVGYALSGSGFLGEERIPISGSEACLFGPGDQLLITGSDTDRENNQLELILLGGLPINEPVAWHGPFVMNTSQELQQAFDDYQSGRLGSTPALGQ